MGNEFLAKSNPRKSIQEHSLDLIKNFEKLKSLYPNIHLDENWEILRLACLYHDLGKMNTKFQNRIGGDLEDKLKNSLEVWHNYLSPAFLPKEKLKEKFNNEKLKILYQAIYYHHNYEDNTTTKDKQDIIEQDLDFYYEDFYFENIGKIENLYPSFDRQVGKRINSVEFEKPIYFQFVLTKGLLNKLDYAASAGVPVEIENKNLFDKTKEYLQKDYNANFNDLQKYFIEHQNDNNIVIASTGMGKTEAALAWIGNSNKGFFTLPLRVSINAIYKRIQNKIGFEDVVLLHSEAFSQLLKDSKNKNEDFDEDVYTMARQWSNPLTICTLDQILDFIFKYDGYEWKLATLSYSKLVIDEIQMYDSDLLAFIIMALKYITEAGGKFSILTATFPMFIKNLLEENGIDFEMPENPFLTTKQRHFIKVLEKDLEVEEDILDFNDKKVLIIVNTVRKAQEIYQNLKKNNKFKDINVNLLHSRFIRKDRKKKEDDIVEMGDKANNNKGIWVTTQIVEASLDIDFDILYTELQDISSLFQRMGRVFRNREYKANNPNVYVFIGHEDNYSPLGIRDTDTSVADIDVFRFSREALLNCREGILDEDEKCKIIDKVYSFDKMENTNYYRKVKNNIIFLSQIIDYELGKNEKKLRKIFSIPIIPESVYIENELFIEENHSKIKRKKSRRDIEEAKNVIKEFVVDLPLYRYKYRYNKDEIVEIKEIELDKYTKIKILNFEYNFENGLGNPTEIDCII